MANQCHKYKITITEEKDRIQIIGNQKSLIALSTVLELAYNNVLEFAYSNKTQATRHIIVNNVLKNVVITCDEEE